MLVLVEAVLSVSIAATDETLLLRSPLALGAGAVSSAFGLGFAVMMGIVDNANGSKRMASSASQVPN